MPLNVDIKDESIKIQGRVPDKLLWIVVAAVLAAFGLEYQEIMGFLL